MEAIVRSYSVAPSLGWNASYQEPDQKNLSYLTPIDNQDTARLKLKIAPFAASGLQWL